MRNPEQSTTGKVLQPDSSTEIADGHVGHKIEPEQSLQDLALKLAGGSTLSEALHLCLEAVLFATGMQTGAAYLLDPVIRCLKQACVQGTGIPFFDIIHDKPATEHLWSLMTSACPAYGPNGDFPAITEPAMPLPSAAIVPVSHRGQAIAAFICANRTSAAKVPLFDSDAIETITILAGNSIAHLRSETALRAMSRRLMEVQEAERRHLSRELHDEVGQCLTLLKMTLDGLRPNSAPSISKFEDAMGQIDHLLAQVRNMALELRPSMLDDLGLLPAIVWHTDRISKLTRIQVDCQHQGIEGRRFLPEVETSAYRILQEAITNAIRHSGSARVTVRIWSDAELLHLQVEDSGWGFNAAEILSRAASSGLRGMHERVLLLGGLLHVDSSPGRGTRITAALPLSVSRIPKHHFHEKNHHPSR
jgi:signal transduction histidine kinase